MILSIMTELTFLPFDYLCIHYVWLVQLLERQIKLNKTNPRKNPDHYSVYLI